MANKRVSEESDASLPLSGAEYVRIVQGGQSCKTQVDNFGKLTTKGDLLSYSTAPARLAVGTNGQVLSVDSGEATGLKWVDANLAGGGGSSSSVEAVRVYNSANQSISDSSETALTFDSESYDTNTLHDTSSNTSRLTCAVAGKYVIQGAAQFAASVVGIRQLRVRLNGTTIIAEESQLSTSGSVASRIGVHTVYALAAGDYIELLAYQSSGGTLAANSGEGTTWFAMTLQGGTPANPTLQSQTFTASGTFTPATGVTGVWVSGSGGGGGGGSRTGALGGGGGGAGEYGEMCAVAVSGAVTVTIGAGGNGAAGGGAAADGSNGGSTTFGSLLTFLGGKGGLGASASTGGNGGGVRGASGGGVGALGTQESPTYFGGSSGGGGATSTGGSGSAGGAAPGSLTGASGGTTASSQAGGGGGGAGIKGLGGAGGNGGAAGTNAAANTGAGGGGAGGLTGSSAAGGNGGSGWLTVFWIG